MKIRPEDVAGSQGSGSQSRRIPSGPRELERPSIVGKRFKEYPEESIYNKNFFQKRAELEACDLWEAQGAARTCVLHIATPRET
jgi:hypothetical protein